MRLWFTPLLLLLVSHLISACSLSIDTSPDGLRQASADSAGAMGARASSAGEVVAGETLAGDDLSGETALGGQAFDVVTSRGAAASDPVDPLRSTRLSATQISEGSLKQRPQDLDPNSFLRPLLPSADCVVQDMITSECLTPLDRGDLSVCYDWQQNYPLTASTLPGACAITSGARRPRRHLAMRRPHCPHCP